MTVDARPFAAEGQAASPPATGSTPSPRARGIGRVADRLVKGEPWLALSCALLLLTYPNPLVIPAALIGVLPALARLIRTGRPWRPTLFDLPLALLVVGALLGGLASLNRDAATVRLTGLLAGLILFAAAREHAGSARRSQVLVVSLLAGATVAVLSLLVVVAPFLLLDHVPPLASAVRALDRWEIGQRLANEDWLLQRYRFRASGVGAMADVGLALVMAVLVGTRSRRTWPLLGLLALFFLSALVTSDNRGSMVAAVLTVSAVATAWQRRLLIVLPLGAALLIVALALGVVERGLSPRTVAQRFWFWENALYLARELPFTGAGLGLDSVRLTYQAYFQPVYPPFSHAHSIYLQGLLEYGIVGLLGLLGLLGATLWLGWRGGRAPDRRVMVVRLAGFGTALAMLTTGLSEIAALTTFGGAILLGAVGLLAATVPSRRGSAPARDVAAPRSRPGPGPFAGLRARPALLATGLLVVVATALSVAGGARRLAAIGLLNAGTVELNRGTISEWVSRSERAAALDRAAWLLRAAADVDGNDLTIQRNLAMALAAWGDEDGAEAAADRARALVNPAAVTARQDYFQLGRAYAAVDSSGETIRAWQAAGASQQLLQLGNRLLRSRSYDQATNAFTAGAMLQPRSRGAYEGIARAARERGETTDDVVQALRPMFDRGGDFEYMAQLEIGRTFREAGRLTEAFAALRAAERLDSGPDLAFELGVTIALGERWDGINRYFERATDGLPLESASWYWHAYSLLRQARPADALAIVDEGFQQASLDRRTDRQSLLTVRGESLLALGRPAEALDAFEEGLSIRRNDARLREDAERARAATAGAAHNMVTNPSFTWDGGWAARPVSGWDGTTPFGDERPRVVGGALRIDGAEPPTRAIRQEVWGLEAGETYRLTVRARQDGTEPGVATVHIAGQSLSVDEVRTSAHEWTPLELSFQASGPVAVVQLALGPDTPHGVALFDDISLVRVSPAR